KAALVRFSPCARERLGVGIEAHDLGSWMETLDEERQVPRPAADVEDVVTRLDVRLIDELPVRRLSSDQLAEDVVQGKKPVRGRCGNVGPLSFGRSSAHGPFLAVNHAYMNRRPWTAAACLDLPARPVPPHCESRSCWKPPVPGLSWSRPARVPHPPRTPARR